MVLETEDRIDRRLTFGRTHLKKAGRKLQVCDLKTLGMHIRDAVHFIAGKNEDISREDGKGLVFGGVGAASCAHIHDLKVKVTVMLEWAVSCRDIHVPHPKEQSFVWFGNRSDFCYDGMLHRILPNRNIVCKLHKKVDEKTKKTSYDIDE